MVKLGFQLVASSVVYKEDVHRIRPDGEDDAVGVSSLAVDQLPDVLGKPGIFGGERAAGGMGLESIDLPQKAVIPPRGEGRGGVPGFPADSLVDALPGRRFDDDAVVHASGERLNSRRISANTSS